MPLEESNRAHLLRVARDSIAAEFGRGTLTAIAPAPDPVLRHIRASFVTLKRQGALRGCIGALEAIRPLFEDVRHNARAAAFHDPRFRPVTESELPDLHIEISVLSPPQPLEVVTRAELVRSLRPAQDGLIIQEGRRRATFLPAVWESLPEAEDFVSHLMQKAGLPPAYWSADLRCFIYATESFGEAS